MPLVGVMMTCSEGVRPPGNDDDDVDTRYVTCNMRERESVGPKNNNVMTCEREERYT